jgi:transcriptional regulator with XRE-family HTH domain
MAKTPLPRFSGTKLLALRVARGWYQRDLSDATECAGHRVSRERISLYETGKGSPGPPAFGALVAALGCEPNDLLDEVEPAVAA